MGKDTELASQVMLVVKNLPASVGDSKRCRINPWVRKIPWSRAWQPTPIILLGEAPWTGKPGRLQPVESQRVGHD